ncbi:helix-turn-helix domain-containing protein [Alteromonas gilva]|uniref:Helix-turn-helix domain-containing protein n=1 Tax=Alteromonas gilva TaxID=2987522 RepID=A0ABT5L334_9ALTE|nr:helix-turn-helix domain-containing protein [Alteromonas gilva]MDC8830257.1 helix-turn-helix domain-containing protein [Alteromonas gilva]
MSVEIATKFEDWITDVSEILPPMNIVRQGNSNNNFIGEIEQSDLNHIRLCTVKSNGVCIDSSAYDKYAQLSGKEYLVKFQLRGNSRVEHRSKVVELTPGDFTICYMEEPFQLQFEKLNKHAVLIIPAQQMNKICPNIKHFLGLLFSKAVTTNALVSQYVINLIDKVHTISPDIVVRIEHILLELLATALSAIELKPDYTDSTPAACYLKSIKNVISANLDNPLLSPDFIAKEEKISKRYLHQLFVSEGVSVSRYIQLKRLEACKRALASPNLQNMSITDIALEWCFSDVSHFHRCFKAHFNLTPRKFRLQALKS